MEHTHASSEAPPEKAAIPPLPVRILQVFVSPAKLFDAIRERPAWLGAVVGLVVLGAAVQLLTPVVVPEDVRRAMFESQIGRFIPPGADPELLEQQVESAMSRGPAAGIATVVIATPIFLSLIAGLSSSRSTSSWGAKAGSGSCSAPPPMRATSPRRDRSSGSL
ncbi:hypothetical protein [Candidatus Palauibacter sp.]|uniref:hypothetical protein n=1 Tax=Candidatus Palauibacter sp. TaxID=3101350 RepID=UPI003C6ED658